MIRLVNENPKQVTLIALGTQTNLAVASKIDPEIFDKLDRLVIMGGLLDVNQGNVRPNTEFNFEGDPDAVQMVLENSQCPLHIVTWDVALQHRIDLVGQQFQFLV